LERSRVFIVQPAAASSRSGIPAIDNLGSGQNASPPDEVAAGLHGFTLNGIDRAAEQSFQRSLEVHEGSEVVAKMRERR
jgi:hypothetical protein